MIHPWPNNSRKNIAYLDNLQNEKKKQIGNRELQLWALTQPMTSEWKDGLLTLLLKWWRNIEVDVQVVKA